MYKAYIVHGNVIFPVIPERIMMGYFPFVTKYIYIYTSCCTSQININFLSKKKNLLTTFSLSFMIQIIINFNVCNYE